MILLIIAIILFVLSIIANIACSYYKSKCTKATEQNTDILKRQNALLWTSLKESYAISTELIKMNLNKEDENPDEVQEETSGS